MLYSFSVKAEWFYNTFIGPVVEFFTSLWNTVLTKVEEIKESVVNGFNDAIRWIKNLSEQALQWGRDIIDNIVEGIKDAVGKAKEQFVEMGGKIKSVFGFSVPEEGMLSDFCFFMPDMMDLMTQGIQFGRARIQEVVRDVAGDLQVLNEMTIASVKTAAQAVSYITRGYPKTLPKLFS